MGNLRSRTGQPCIPLHPVRRVPVTPPGVCSGGMALDDRDYYREELARKRGIRPPGPFGRPSVPSTPLLDQVIAAQVPPSSPPAPPEPPPSPPETPLSAARWPWRVGARRRRRAGVMAAVAMAAFVAVAARPVGLTPRCNGVATWRHSPVACWRDSAATLIAGVERNMAATRGYPVIVVRVDR